ncbi:MAG: alpha/beta fold hydrolase, partial [Woeseiaceae bacterium]
MKTRTLTLVLVSTLVWTAGAAGADVKFRKHYVDGTHGQVHVLLSQPLGRQAAQTPMLCLAPNPMAGRYYRLFMQELGQDRQMIAPDYPGLGLSDPPSDALDMAGYADAMAGVLDALGYGANGSGRVDVCGYHTGAMVAIELAVRRPDLVDQLVLAGIPYYDAEERPAQYQKNVVAKVLEDNFDSLRGTWEFAVTTREKGVAIERGYDNFVDILLQRFRSHWPYHAVFSYAAEQQAPKVSQPVLILNTHGSLENETRALARYFRNATLIEIPELHHGVFD